MKKTIFLSLVALGLCGCGMNENFVRNRFAKWETSRILEELEANKRVMDGTIMEDAPVNRLQRRLMYEELNRRGVTIGGRPVGPTRTFTPSQVNRPSALPSQNQFFDEQGNPKR